MAAVVLAPSAQAADSLPTLEEPVDFAVTLKSDARGLYFALTLTVPESVQLINNNISRDLYHYKGYTCQPVTIEIEFKYAGYNWNLLPDLVSDGPRGPKVYATDILLQDYLASGDIPYFPFEGSGWTAEMIKAETYYFRVRFGFDYTPQHSLPRRQVSRYSNTAVIKGEGISRRIFGATRKETAIAVSLEGWGNGSENVILTREDNYPDALTGTPLSKQLDAPILFTNSKKLTPATEEEIWRLKARNVYILGGATAVSQEIENYLKKDFTVIRIGGKDRYETSKLIALKLGYTGKVMITTGLDYHDALVGAPMAACDSMPVLLTKPKELPQFTKEALAQIKPTEIIVVGSLAAVGPEALQGLNNVQRISGQNDYETAVLVAKHFNAYAGRILLVTGLNWPDALAGSGLAAKYKSPTLYVTDPLPQQVVDYLSLRKKIRTEINILGGDVAVPTKVKVAVDKIFQ